MALAADAMALAAVVRAAQLCTRGKGQLGLAEPPTDFAHSQTAARSVWCCIWLIQAQKARRCERRHGICGPCSAASTCTC